MALWCLRQFQTSHSLSPICTQLSAWDGSTLATLPCAVHFSQSVDLKDPANDMVVLIGSKDALPGVANVPESVPFHHMLKGLSGGDVSAGTASTSYSVADGGEDKLCTFTVCCTSTTASRHNSPLRPDQIWQFCKKQVLTYPLHVFSFAFAA